MLLEPEANKKLESAPGARLNHRNLHLLSLVENTSRVISKPMDTHSCGHRIKISRCINRHATDGLF